MGEQQLNAFAAFSIALQQFIELRQEHGGLQSTQWKRIVASLNKNLCALIDSRIACEYRSATTGGQQLTAAEAQHPHVPPGTRRAALDLSTLRLAGVFHDTQPMPVSNVRDLLHIGQTAVQVRHDDRSRFGTHGLSESRGVQAPCLRIDVNKDREGSHRLNRSKVAGKIVTGQNYFLARSHP